MDTERLPRSLSLLIKSQQKLLDRRLILGLDTDEQIDSCRCGQDVR